MKYCFFSAQYLPTAGGVEWFTYHMACQLIKKQHSVIIVTSALPGLPQYEVSAEGIVIYRFPSMLLLGGRMPVPKVNGSFIKLKKKFMQEQIDFAVIQTQLYLNSVLGASWMKKKKVPAMLLEHGTSHISLGKPALDLCASLYEHYTTFRIKRGCKLFHGVSLACNEWLSHFKIKADGVLYNCISPSEIEAVKSEKGTSFRSQLKLPQDIKIISFAGRLVKEKGVLKLLQAAALAKAENLPVHVIIAGDGPLRGQAEAEKPENVSFVGSLPHKQVLALMCESEIFCLPTDYAEGFPTGVLEAAACGAFVITTSRGGSKELISDEGLGIILKQNNAAELYNAFKKVLSNEAYRISAVEKCREKLLQQHTWDKASDVLIDISVKAQTRQ